MLQKIGTTHEDFQLKIIEKLKLSPIENKKEETPQKLFPEAIREMKILLGFY